MAKTRRGAKKKNGKERAAQTAREARERIGLTRHWALPPTNPTSPAAERAGQQPSTRPQQDKRPTRPAAESAGGKHTLAEVNQLLSRTATKEHAGQQPRARPEQTERPTPPAAQGAGGKRTLAEVNATRLVERTLGWLYHSGQLGRCGIRHYLLSGAKRVDLVCLHEKREEEQVERDTKRRRRA